MSRRVPHYADFLETSASTDSFRRKASNKLSYCGALNQLLRCNNRAVALSYIGQQGVIRMTRHEKNELTDLQGRIQRLQMTTSERAAAMAALHNGFVLVERLTWLTRKVLQLGALLSPSPALRAHYRHG